MRLVRLCAFSSRRFVCASSVQGGSFVRLHFLQVRLCALSSKRFVCAPLFFASSFVRLYFLQVRLCALSSARRSFVRLQPPRRTNAFLRTKGAHIEQTRTEGAPRNQKNELKAHKLTCLKLVDLTRAVSNVTLPMGTDQSYIN
jgi:hypothetical protein